jgi:hypothetical protein
MDWRGLAVSGAPENGMWRKAFEGSWVRQIDPQMGDGTLLESSVVDHGFTLGLVVINSSAREITDFATFKPNF